MKSNTLVVNFGASKSGLSTVGYTVYNKDNAIVQARTTAGVFEIGSGTGIYGSSISLDEGFEGFILWDTGDASIRYGVEEALAQLNHIQDGTDLIRIIYNSLKNQGEVHDKLIDLMRGLDVAVGRGETTTLAHLIKLLEALEKKPNPPSSDDLKRALSVQVSVPSALTDEVRAIRASLDVLRAQDGQRLAQAVVKLEVVASKLAQQSGALSTKGEMLQAVTAMQRAMRELAEEVRVTLAKNQGMDELARRISDATKESKTRGMLALLGLDE